MEQVLIGNLKYSLNSDNNRASVVGVCDKTINHISIPVFVEYDGMAYFVYSIAEFAFCSCDKLISVSISNSVREIGDGAFECCYLLEKISIPSSVTFIGERAFYYCSNLASITLPDQIKFIGGMAFSKCKSLKYVKIPEGINEIESKVYSEIPEWDFCGMFQGCINLEEVVLPNSLTTITKRAFYGCTSLKRITLPNNLQTIEEEAFAECSSIESVIIPQSVNYIGSNAFDECQALMSITLWANVKIHFDDSVFAGLKDDLKISLIANDVKEFCNSKVNKKLVEEGIRNDRLLFINNKELKCLVIPYEYEYIESHAFYKCVNIQSVEVSAPKISQYAFGFCFGLINLKISNTVRYIESNAFESCYNVENITIPCTIQDLEHDAFNMVAPINSCVAKITANSFKEYCSSRIDYKLFYAGYHNEKNIFINNEPVIHFSIPSSVKRIEKYTLFWHTSIISVTLPDTIIEIEKMAFEDCKNLKHIYIPNDKKELYIKLGLDRHKEKIIEM